jgi:alcohol dehydrogenase
MTNTLLLSEKTLKTKVSSDQKNIMRALVYHSPGRISWDEKIKPSIINAGDAIVKICKTTICGTDLHILKGDLPEVNPGRTLGHEGVGIVEQVGNAVTEFKPGDHVLISCISSCGKCDYCKKGMYSHCREGGWILGHNIDGTQAEYVRIPFADNSLYHVPENSDEEALVMLSDILPTGFECGVLNGQVKPGDIVAIIGAGPIGLASLLTAQFYTPAMIIMIDVDDNRLAVAKDFGATQIINSVKEDVVQVIMNLTESKGVDVAIEAVGIPPTFELCELIIGAGGHIANIGVHGKSVELHLEKLWSKNITISTRLVDTVTTPMLLKTVVAEKLNASKMITHHFRLDDIIEAYDTFKNAAREKALKVILTNN